jgi:hypothetical protein
MVKARRCLGHGGTAGGGFQPPQQHHIRQSSLYFTRERNTFPPSSYLDMLRLGPQQLPTVAFLSLGMVESRGGYLRNG